jgi:hypothetical protein
MWFEANVAYIAVSDFLDLADFTVVSSGKIALRSLIVRSVFSLLVFIRFNFYELTGDN